MRQLIYYVAISLDGFIARLDEDISGFVQGGNGVEKYMNDLKDFDTVIMGRKTYEFGYKYGLQPGQPAYPHMKHYIFSTSLSFENQYEQVQVCPLDLKIIKDLKAEGGSPIYLCGGGEFAGWLLENQLIDQLKVKLNPLLIGEGIPLFGSSKKQYKLELLEGQAYENGLQILTYEIGY
ncbi:dihydrofolate reductase family protein [Flammeovirgaceae bacterium SG7u.111]|nr:dihydrofolate reductase family protein [Flammeovirgaceae bacterium SG7u.132]WPO33625.1 dihydrofolate reductase family protein [Flammeovirgaceae bacterium SG7u.111]